MDARRLHLSEHRARIERRRGFLILAGTAIFAVVARLLML